VDVPDRLWRVLGVVEPEAADLGAVVELDPDFGAAGAVVEVVAAGAVVVVVGLAPAALSSCSAWLISAWAASMSLW